VNLNDVGWDAAWEAAFQLHAPAGCEPARAVAEHRGAHVLLGAGGEYRAGVAGRLRHLAADAAGLPAVGDWVFVTRDAAGETATVRGLLPRRTAFVRRAAGMETAPQVLAANIDVVLVAMALDLDFSVDRVERYLTLAWESGAQPRVVLTKADLCSDLDGAVEAVSAVSFGVPVSATDAARPRSFEPIAELLGAGLTGVVLGSSGVGKSTLINRLLGEERQAVSALAADGTGRHTTTVRQLLTLPAGGCVIDTPGLREVQLWAASDGLDATFADVEELAVRCRFRDCVHRTEPGCAVLAAIADGSLPEHRLERYRKLERELRWAESRGDARARAEERRRWAQINRDLRTTRW